MSIVGTPAAGVFLLDKKLKITSQKAILELKRKLSLDKIGHCGTLDPLATGLLVCLTGRATRLASYVEKNDKIYSGTIQFGIQTTTDDLEGEVILESTNRPNLDQIATVINKKFTGKISQMPPTYSALKVDGKRAYKLAREGKTVELKARQIDIKSFKYELIADNLLQFEIKSTVGTYIRSIARELGEALGCYGTIASLRREASLPFLIKDAKTIEELQLTDIFPWTLLFSDAIFMEVSQELAQKLHNGLPQALVEFTKDLESTDQPIIYQFNGEPLGLIVNDDINWQFAFRAKA